MFDYARNMRLAIGDKLRRSGLMAGAGVAMLIGAGFLLAALWIWLADHLGWGSLGASLAIGGGLVLIGLVVMLIARTERHRAPTTDELKAEIEQRLTLVADIAVEKATGAADAALNRATQKASRLMGLAENRVHSVADSLSYKADRLADRTEARVCGTARRAKENAARKLGIFAGLTGGAEGGKQSNAAALAPLIGAFAIGMTLASRLRHRDDPADGPEDDLQDK